jgi:hypothetical protein
MPIELRRQSSPRPFRPSPRTVKRPPLTLVGRQPNAGEQARESEQPPSALLALGLASGNAQVATAALFAAPDDPATAMALRGWLIQSLLLEAITRDAFGDGAAAEQSLEHALDLARRDRVLLPFLVHPVPALLERHAGPLTAHADLIAEILNLPAAENPASPVSGSTTLREPLTESDPASCAICPRTSPHERSLTSSTCRFTRSSRTSSTSTPSSTPTAVARPSSAPGSSGSSHAPCETAEPRRADTYLPTTQVCQLQRSHISAHTRTLSSARQLA